MSDDRVYYRGRALETLTKPELIDAFTALYRQYRELMSPENIQARAIGEVQMFVQRMMEEDLASGR